MTVEQKSCKFRLCGISKVIVNNTHFKKIGRVEDTMFLFELSNCHVKTHKIMIKIDFKTSYYTN